MVSPGALQRDLAACQPDGDEIGRCLDPIGDDGVLDGGQFIDALDFDGGGAGADDPRTHPVEEGGQVGDLGLAGGVVDDRGPLRQDAGHHEIFGGADARVLQLHAGPDEAGAAGDPALDVAVAVLEGGAHGFEAAQVHVDRPGAEVVTPGYRHLCLAEPSQQGAEDDDRCPHLLDQVVRGLGNYVGTPSYPQDPALVCVPGDGETHRGKQVAHQRHVDDPGNVAQRVFTLGEHRRRHKLEDRVLGSRDRHDALEGPARTDHELLDRRTFRHAASMTGCAPCPMCVPP